MYMKQNRLHRWMVVIIAIIYLVILVGTICSFSLDAFPKPTVQTMVNGVWSQELEHYLTEYLGFHDVLFQMKSRTDMFVGEKMIQGVYVTDDMLLEKLLAEDVPEPEMSAAPVNAFYNATGMPTCLVLVPSASEIYKTRLRANAVSEEQKNRIQAVYTETTSGVRCVDAYNILASLKGNYIYYRTDTHWTCYGAYYVYQAAIQKLGFTAVPYDRYVIMHVSTDFRGDLYQRTLYTGVKSDVLDWYSDEGGAAQITEITAYYSDGHTENRGRQLYQTAALETDDMYQFYLGAPCEKLVIRTNLNNDRKLLLYKDDFGDCLVPFLVQHYSEICVVDLEQVGDAYLTSVDTTAYTQAMFLCSMKNWEKMW